MFSYIIPLVALVIVFSNPIAQLFISPNRSLRTERPAINESLLAIPGLGDGEGCEGAYKVHVWSAEPLVIYIEGFLSEAERVHLLETSEPLFEPSTVTNDGSTTRRNTAVRDSHVALLPRDRTTRCVEARARALQGWREEVWVERLRTQRYRPGGHYAHHYDWGSNAGGWGRVSSFMAWVGAEGLEGGGTEFPVLPSRGAVRGGMRADEEEGELKRDEDGGSELGKEEGEDPWCRFVECESGRVKTGEEGLGVTFKAIEGNAVFWTNFRADGSGEGYRETLHAGLPVTKGEKVGLNIWSWGRI